VGGGCLAVLVYVAAEIAAASLIAPRIGGWPTLILVLLAKAVLIWPVAGALGRHMARRQARALAEGARDLGPGLGDGALVLGVVLLALPAPLVNVLGLLLLLPTRALLVPLVRRRLERALGSGRFVMVDFAGFAGGRGSAPPGGQTVIDVDAEVVGGDAAAPPDPPRPEDPRGLAAPDERGDASPAAPEPGAGPRRSGT
jgi:UPF0716 protein FxsA